MGFLFETSVMATLVSVVIPAYNGAEFIGESMRSVFGQSLPPAEIVVVDDASTDETVTRVREIAATAPLPVKLIKLPANHGAPAEPLNIGIRAASGEVIALLDQDDLFETQKLEHLVSVLEDLADIDFVLSDYYELDAAGRRQGGCARELWGGVYSRLIYAPGGTNIIPGPLCLSAFIQECGLPRSCSNHCFRRSLWSRIGGFDPSFGPIADYEFALRAIVGKMAWVDRELFGKRKHDRSLWRPSSSNSLAVLKAQRTACVRAGCPGHMRRHAIAKTRAMMWGLRQDRKWYRAFEQVLMLLRMGAPIAAAVEAIKTAIDAVSPRSLSRWLRAALQSRRTSPRANSADGREVRLGQHSARG